MMGRSRRRAQCQHLYARSIHGDEINATGKRGHCPDCGTWLDALPYTFVSPSIDYRIAMVPHAD